MRGTARAAAVVLAVAVCGLLWYLLRSETPGAGSGGPGGGDHGSAALDGERGGGGTSPAGGGGPAVNGSGGTAAPPLPASAEDGPFVAGRVVDGRGRPIAGASVTAIAEPPPLTPVDVLRLIDEISSAPVPADGAVCDGDGRFALRRLTPGTYRLAAQAEGFARGFSPALSLAPEPGGGRPVDVVLGAGFPVAGRVVGADGLGIAGATVIALPQFDGEDPPAVRTATTTDEKGEFRLPSMAPGRHVVVARVTGHPARVDDRVVVPLRAPLVLRMDGTAALEVTVVDPGEEAIAGASILLLSGRRGGQIARGTTDGSGKVLLEHLAPGRPDLAIVQARGHGAYPSGENPPRPPELVAGATTPWKVVLRRGAVVRGRVTDRGDGAPVPGAVVSLHGASGFLPVAAGSAVASEDGSFAMEGVAAGKYLLLARAEGRATAPPPADRGEREGELLSVEEGVEEVWRDVILDRAASLAGRVTTADGSPVAGAEVRWTARAAGGEPALFPGAAVSDASGAFLLEPLPPGRPLTLVASAPGHTGAILEAVTVAAGERRTDVVLAFGPGAVVRGTVLGPSDAPVAGATVSVSRTVRGPRNLREPRPAVTDAEGRFEFRGLTPGKITLTVIHAAHAEASAGVEATPDAPAEILLRVKAAGAIHGRILDGAGRPVADARLELESEEEDGGTRAQRAESDGLGEFRFDGVPLGERFSLVVDHPQSVESITRGLAAGGPPVEVRLVAGLRIEGVLVDDAGAPLRGFHVTAQGPGGDHRAPRPTGEDGRFALARLPEGVFTLTCSGGRGVRPELARAPLPGVAAGTANVVYALRTGLVITGTVRFPDGAPAPGARVEATETGPGASSDHRPQARARGDGGFTLQGTVPGARYRVTAAGDGMLPGDVPDVEAGATDVVVLVRRAEVVAGVVVDAAGAPAAGARVTLRQGGATHGTRTGRDGTFRFTSVEPGPCEVAATRGGGQGPADTAWTATRAGERNLRIVLNE